MNKLPQDLGNGLRLRWATAQDIDAVAQFNVEIHSDTAEPEMWLHDWTTDLMNGRHPTTTASDFTIVIDTNKNNKIVSSMNLISQQWTYDGLPFGVGRPELVGTDPTYRRQSLVRSQFEAIHAKSESRGELVQAITGIPWYYGLFGYQMALSYGGGRNFFWNEPGNMPKNVKKTYQVRAAEPADLAQLLSLYQIHTQQSMICRVRDAECGRFEIFESKDTTPYHRHVEVVLNQESEIVAYFELKQWGNGYLIREIGVLPGHSWRPILIFIIDQLKQRAVKLNKERTIPITAVSFSLGQQHQVFDALGEALAEPYAPYAWYIRVPNIVAFLAHITPVLEERLAQSVLVGHHGRHQLNLIDPALELVFENGRLINIEPYEPKFLFQGDGLFPDRTFLHLLFGHMSRKEILASNANCSVRDKETAVLLDILFPKRPSAVVPLG